MSAIVVDIATRFLGPTEDIYIIRPGEGFSLYAEFLRLGAVFLDFPDLEINPNYPFPKHEEMRERVYRSQAIRAWHKQHRRETEPSRFIEDYKGQAKGRRLGRHVAAIQRLYYELPTGTIIVVPGPGYFSDVLICEISSETYQTRDVAVYPGEAILARKIKVIGRRPKAYFPEELRERLQKPSPIMALERSLRSYILAAAYGQYSIGDRYSSRFVTNKHDFSTLDDYKIQTFMNYVSGVLAAISSGDDRDKLSIADAIQALGDRRDLVPEMTANINSPGALRLTSSRLTPLVIAVLYSIAVACPAGTVPTDLKVLNNATPNDPCALTVQQHAVETITRMDIDEWKKVCVMARDAAQSTGMSTDITVIPDVASQ